ncbi:TrbC/VirB2 family protein [Kribbella sp. NPDC048928]|uniref:TrbC/VirB2 family protein n=1 Tax=Kribbella sp. NPDC048928 TaxID=3364111 RepID=UPI0037221DA9
MMLLHHLATELPTLVPMTEDLPKPVTDGLDTVVSWVKYIAYIVCGLGIIIAGGMMAIGQRRGEGGEHAARLGWVLAACIVIGAATAIVDTLK